MPFKVPSEETQHKAIGIELKKATNGSKHSVIVKYKDLYNKRNTPFHKKNFDAQESLELALDPILNAHLFNKIPAPGKDDWLAINQEPGETFQNYAQHNFDKVVFGKRNKIYIVPLGNWKNIGKDFLQSVQDYAEAYFTGMEVKVMEPVDLECKRLVTRINRYTDQEQYRTTELLGLLKKMMPQDAYCISGITFHDLYPNETYNFVFGEASPQARTGVYSFARYDPAFFGEEREENYEQVKLLRTVTVMTHEICHQFGMEHCIYYHCCMNGANHLEESDRQPPHECPVCLRKLHYAIGFDIVQRYTNLLQWFQKHGFIEQVSWLEERLRVLSKGNASDVNNNDEDTADFQE